MINDQKSSLDAHIAGNPPLLGIPLMSSAPPNLAEIVQQRVENRTGRRILNLRVEVGADWVVLRGRTSSYHVKQLAQHGAQEALPAARLENAIVVE